jgi:hypothetical protein
VLLLENNNEEPAAVVQVPRQMFQEILSLIALIARGTGSSSPFPSSRESGEICAKPAVMAAEGPGTGPAVSPRM